MSQSANQRYGTDNPELHEQLAQLGDQSRESEENTQVADTASPEVAPVASPLGRVATSETLHSREQDVLREEGSKIGYKNMPIENLPSSGRCMPRDTKVEFRAATVDEIKHYSGMDEGDYQDIAARIAEVLKACVRVTLGKGRRGSYQDLEETDKLFMLFAIRDYTLAKNGREHVLNQPCECPKCGNGQQIDINSETFGYYQIPNGVLKHYDDTERCFVVKDNRIGEPLRLFIPTMGTMEFMQEYMLGREMAKRRGEGGFYDKQFLSFLQFLVKDWRDLSDSFVRTEYIKYGRWNDYRHDAMVAAVKHLNVGIRPTVQVTCSKEGCGHEYQSFVRFPGGYSSILALSGIGAELFSDTE